VLTQPLTECGSYYTDEVTSASSAVTHLSKRVKADPSLASPCHGLHDSGNKTFWIWIGFSQHSMLLQITLTVGHAV
jgi:hypothetical protein